MQLSIHCDPKHWCSARRFALCPTRKTWGLNSSKSNWTVNARLNIFRTEPQARCLKPTLSKTCSRRTDAKRYTEFQLLINPSGICNSRIISFLGQSWLNALNTDLCSPLPSWIQSPDQIYILRGLLERFSKVCRSLGEVATWFGWSSFVWLELRCASPNCSHLQCCFDLSTRSGLIFDWCGLYTPLTTAILIEVGF